MLEKEIYEQIRNKYTEEKLTKMKEISYKVAKIKSKFSKNAKETINNYFRKSGMKIGGGCNICCNIMTAEPYLVEIGDNVTISGDVKFVTHDNSISKIDKKCPNIFGKIIIGNNCFIGQSSILLYGVELTENVIVAAGSVVVNSFSQEKIIIGGNPARIISTWDKFYEKGRDYAMSKTVIEDRCRTSPELLLRRREYR